MRLGKHSVGMMICAMMITLAAEGLSKSTAAQEHATASGTKLITLGTAGGPLPQKIRTQSSNLLVERAPVSDRRG